MPFQRITATSGMFTSPSGLHRRRISAVAADQSAQWVISRGERDKPQTRAPSARSGNALTSNST